MFIDSGTLVFESGILVLDWLGYSIDYCIILAFEHVHILIFFHLGPLLFACINR